MCTCDPAWRTCTHMRTTIADRRPQHVRCAGSRDACDLITASRHIISNLLTEVCCSAPARPHRCAPARARAAATLRDSSRRASSRDSLYPRACSPCKHITRRTARFSVISQRGLPEQQRVRPIPRRAAAVGAGRHGREERTARGGGATRGTWRPPARAPRPPTCCDSKPGGAEAGAPRRAAPLPRAAPRHSSRRSWRRRGPRTR